MGYFRGGLSLKAWERLNREQGYLMQARVHFKQAGDDDLVQMAFAENQEANDAIGVIRQFVALVDTGITPPPHILAAVSSRFRGYKEANGGLSLDEAFGLSRKQRIGHPLKHRAEVEKRGKIIHLMWILRQEKMLSGNDISIEDAAGEIINLYGLDLSEDTLKKAYIKKNADKIFGDFYATLRDVFSDSKGKQ